MWHFKLQTSAFQLSWIKRLTNITNDSWKVLPKYLYNCEDLLTYFNSNHPLLHNKNIPVFYQTIHQEYMKYFKLPPTNIIEVYEQSLWLNKHITINNKLIFWKQWQKHGINTINNLLDNKNKFLAHTEINHKFGIKCTYLDIAQYKVAYLRHGNK